MFRTSLEKLKSLQENVNWGSEDERVKLLVDLWDLIHDWKGKLPNFEEVFEDDEIHALLLECATNSFRDMPVPGESLYRVTAVHRAGINQPNRDWQEAIFDLFEIYNRFEANYEDKCGTTHFHVACKFGCPEVVWNFLELGRVNPDRVCGRSGELPLVLALRHDNEHVYQLLLERGANPNATDASGLTPLHHLSQRCRADDLKRMSELFGSALSRGEPLDVDAQCKGKTPLHVAVSLGRMDVAELLLKNGADPNCADERGSTALHVIVENEIYHEGKNLAEKFFEIDDKIVGDLFFHNFAESLLNQLLMGLREVNITYKIIKKMVQIDARDKNGNTPLHLALSLGHKAIIKSLLRRGADLNLANEEGSTPLHVICQRKTNDNLIKLFFKIIGDVQKTVQVDVRDNEGWTPLQWAVANILPNAVDVLLAHGADLSTFVFPTEAHFAECFDARLNEVAFKLRLACGLLEVVKRLENGGYELSDCDAITTMKLFSRYGLFLRSALDQSWYRDQQEFSSIAKEVIHKHVDLSLHDLIQLPIIEAKKIIATYMDYYEGFKLLGPLLARHGDCVSFTCEKLSRDFFLAWGIEFFTKLINFRLPPECSQMIIEQLNNEDLFNICLVAKASR